ncbi:hypothetical protein KSS87_012121 [Heliosperma pusillum]|nr:hypothetical protein KSS87_016710 [Heliosperma pusillum]KAH9625520.1 hypothetical protein KSS87_012121 [Heliosperma pusillum]
MTSKNSTPIRAAGQRSIPSTLLFRPPLKSLPSNKDGLNQTSERSKGGSNVSLTSFLNRKLNTSTTTVIPVQKDKDEIFEKPSEGRTCVIEESVFKLLNTRNSEEKDRKRSSESLTALSSLQGDAKKARQKHLLVLGDDPKPKRRAYRRVSNGDDKPKPLYNHYENGTGWWDSEREGIDNDAVGHKEVWEGVGSTTLGGLDWH